MLPPDPARDPKLARWQRWYVLTAPTGAALAVVAPTCRGTWQATVYRGLAGRPFQPPPQRTLAEAKRYAMLLLGEREHAANDKPPSDDAGEDVPF